MTTTQRKQLEEALNKSCNVPYSEGWAMLGRAVRGLLASDVASEPIWISRDHLAQILAVSEGELRIPLAAILYGQRGIPTVEDMAWAKNQLVAASHAPTPASTESTCDTPQLFAGKPIDVDLGYNDEALEESHQRAMDRPYVPNSWKKYWNTIGEHWLITLHDSRVYLLSLTIDSAGTHIMEGDWL